MNLILHVYWECTILLVVENVSHFSHILRKKDVVGMNTCERCGNEYRFFVDHGGHKLCRDCWNKCSICGKKLPLSNKIGAQMTLGSALFSPVALFQVTGKLEREQKPWIGSGLCMDCYHDKERKEREEMEIIKEAKLRRAKEIIETPMTWTCQYCNAVNKGNFCFNCGSPKQGKTAFHLKTN
jgi:hypothetical protein